MATLSFDGQSLIVDGRRIWIVSGAIHYARVPHELWRDRIRAAKQAGLNCIDTFVFWNVHEPHPKQFQFDGDADLRRFIKIIQEEGLYCILRPGPFVDADCDFGGLPAWVTTLADMKLRQNHPAFLEAVSRYFGAVMEKVRDLQITSRHAGPIVTMQAENKWYSHHPQRGEAYLEEIIRRLRETGCQVPITLANNLWQRAAGTIDTWCAGEHLAGDLRQLRVVQPQAPRFVCDYPTGHADRWGVCHETGPDADRVLYDLAQILASGAQYNLQPFHGGTNLTAGAGRGVGLTDGFITTSYDVDAPLHEGGARGAKFNTVKRISTFANHFGRVFAHLDGESMHAAVLPSPGGGASVIHQRGSQGDVVFLFKPHRDKTADIDLLLPNGLTLPVPMGKGRVAWLLLDTNLQGNLMLTYTNLRPWTLVGEKMLVLFGPAGADGIVCLNDAVVHLPVPRGRTPLVQPFEDLQIVVLNEKQVDAAYPTAHGIVMGAAGLDENDEPVPLAGWPAPSVLGLNAKRSFRRIAAAKAVTVPRLGPWQQATAGDLISGESKLFKPIDGPTSLDMIDATAAYGWYRLTVESPGCDRVLPPVAGDRLTFYQEGARVGLFGVGPAAQNDPITGLVGGDLVVLAENLGRFSGGWRLSEPKGIGEHFYAVKQARLTNRKVTKEVVPDAAAVGDAFACYRYDERPSVYHYTWQIEPVVRRPMVLDIDGLPVRAMVIVNGEPVGLYDPQQSAGFVRFLLEQGRHITGGRNRLRLALLDRFRGAPSKYLRVYQCTTNLTAIKPWAFAQWQTPTDSAFTPVTASRSNLPCWHRTTFTTLDIGATLWLELVAMSKGRIILNGHDVGRYFTATATGKAVGPQKRYYLPEPWLHRDRPNVLVLFDEHGKDPQKCRLIRNADSPFDP